MRKFASVDAILTAGSNIIGFGGKNVPVCNNGVRVLNSKDHQFIDRAHYGVAENSEKQNSELAEGIKSMFLTNWNIVPFTDWKNVQKQKKEA